MKQEVASKTEEEIDEVRSGYTPVRTNQKRPCVIHLFIYNVVFLYFFAYFVGILRINKKITCLLNNMFCVNEEIIIIHHRVV